MTNALIILAFMGIVMGYSSCKLTAPATCKALCEKNHLEFDFVETNIINKCHCKMPKPGQD